MRRICRQGEGRTGFFASHSSADTFLSSAFDVDDARPRAATCPPVPCRTRDSTQSPIMTEIVSSRATRPHSLNEGDETRGARSRRAGRWRQCLWSAGMRAYATGCAEERQTLRSRRAGHSAVHYTELV
jgi:hypothetical protein